MDLALLEKEFSHKKANEMVFSNPNNPTGYDDEKVLSDALDRMVDVLDKLAAKRGMERKV